MSQLLSHAKDVACRYMSYTDLTGSVIHSGDMDSVNLNDGAIVGMKIHFSNLAGATFTSNAGLTNADRYSS